MTTTSELSPRRLLRGLACAFYGMGLAFTLPLSVLLLTSAETWPGRIFAVAALAALAAPGCWLYLRTARQLWKWDGRKHALPLQIAIVLVLVSVPVLFWLAPTGHSIPGALVQSGHLQPATYPRWSPWNLVPEIEQVKLGTLIIPAFDPYIDGPQSRRLRELILPHYRRMEAVPEYRDLGSALPLTYRDFWRLGTQPGHYYACVPPADPGERLPLLVFLHGSWGNFRFYLAALESFARQHRVVVVMPSLGFGTWPENDAVPLISLIVDHCLASYSVDPDRIFLGGISNGSIGVAAAATPLADRWAGLVLISPILRQDSFETPAFADALRGRPVLILHGEADRRISLASVQIGAQLLQRQGLIVSLESYPGEDHFLFVSQLEDVQARLAEFILR